MEIEGNANINIFNIYHVNSEQEYTDFLNNIDPVIAVTMLVAAVSKAQHHGVYTDNESEILSKCINKLVINNNIKSDEISN